jgi:LL-diaminopimelate aminotransferase
VEFAKKHNLIVIHDAAYAALVFEGKPLSFLATPGAMDVGVELHSMSKGFNMTGWRLGFVVGNPLIVKAYADVKDNSDSGSSSRCRRRARSRSTTPRSRRRSRQSIRAG